MSELDQNWRAEEHCPNDRFLICKRTLAEGVIND
jgi:hypothetical protein